jgi:hypothetical protein
MLKRRLRISGQQDQLSGLSTALYIYTKSRKGHSVLSGVFLLWRDRMSVPPECTIVKTKE